MNHTLKCFLVDDDQDSIESLTRILKQYCPDISIVGCSTIVSEAKSFLSMNNVDILFLDIRMNNETGFDLLAGLPGFSGSLIFVTAFDEFGLKAIKFSATDYLLKPVVPVELQQAVAKARKMKLFAHTQQQIDMLLQSLANQPLQQQKKIALADAEEIRYVNIEEIIYAKSDNSYTTFYMADQPKLTISKPIGEYESLLAPYGFIRIHQSFLVNKYRISSYKKEDGGYLVMEDKTEIPVSRQRRGLLKELF